MRVRDEPRGNLFLFFGTFVPSTFSILRIGLNDFSKYKCGTLIIK